MPERVYNDLVDFIYDHEEDIKLGIDNFGDLRSVLFWIERKMK